MVAKQVGRPPITRVKDRIWYKRRIEADEENGHLIWTGPGEVNRFKAPVAEQSSKRVNVRRELYNDSVKHESHKLGPTDRLVVQCSEEKCCAPDHMRVADSSEVNAAMYRAKRRKFQQPPWLVPGTVRGVKATDFTVGGKAAFYIMRKVAGLFCENWTEGFVYRHMMEQNADNPVGLIVDLMAGTPRSIQKYLDVDKGVWRQDSFEECLKGVINEPMFDRVIEGDGADFQGREIPQMIVSDPRLVQPFINLVFIGDDPWSIQIAEVPDTEDVPEGGEVSEIDMLA